MRLNFFIYLAVLTVTVGLLGCSSIWGEHRYFSNIDEAIAHFEHNQAVFQSLVDNLEKSNDLSDFGYRRWDGGSIVWNNAVVAPINDGYVVRKNNATVGSKVSLEKAAEIIGTSVETLNWWKGTAEKYEIQSISIIGTKLPKERRYIEISLRGSERGPYGYIYIPHGNISEPQVDGVSPYTLVKPIGNRWFYFESKL